MRKTSESDSVERFMTNFVLLKRFELGPIWTGENSFVNFFVFVKIFAKNVYPCSQRLHWHGVWVIIDYTDYADTM